MKKTPLLPVLVLASTSLHANTGHFYVSPALYLQTVSAEHSNYFGYLPELSAGYDKKWEKYYLSGEVFVVPFSGTLHNSVNPQATSTDTASGFGASVLPGVLITARSVGFLRAGLIQMRFAGPNRAATGAQLGIGLLTPMSDTWDFRAEYVYTTYRSVTDLGSPTSNMIGAGLVYHFDPVETIKEQVAQLTLPPQQRSG